MNMNNQILILVVVAVLVFVFWNMNNSKPVVEGFLGNLPNMTYKVDRVAGSSYGDMYSIPGQYQSILAPRFSNTDYGAHIRYNIPDRSKLGVPSDPLTYSKVVDEPIITLENYDGGAPVCSKGGIGFASSPYAAPASNNMTTYDAQLDKLSYTPTSDMLPVGDMTAVGADGDIDQPLVYDRFMYANQKSRLYAASDFIRGDLPIIPLQGNWFVPAVNPQIDLNSGALSVTGGLTNETNRQLLALQNAASGGLLDVGSGVNYSVQKSNYLTSGGSDLQITAFP